MRQKNMVTGPLGPGTKNDCVGEGQQQFTQPPDAPTDLNTLLEKKECMMKENFYQHYSGVVKCVTLALINRCFNILMMKTKETVTKSKDTLGPK
jgi:hypothetical protein